MLEIFSFYTDDKYGPDGVQLFASQAELEKFLVRLMQDRINHLKNNCMIDADLKPNVQECERSIKNGWILEADDSLKSRSAWGIFENHLARAESHYEWNRHLFDLTLVPKSRS